MIDTIRFRGPAEYYAFDWDYSRFVGFKTKDNKKEYVNEILIQKTPNFRVWYYPASDTIDVECNPHKIIYGDNVYNYSDSGGALNALVRQFGNYFYRSGTYFVTRCDIGGVHTYDNPLESSRVLEGYRRARFPGARMSKFRHQNYADSVFYSTQNWSIKIYNKGAEMKGSADLFKDFDLYSTLRFEKTYRFREMKRLGMNIETARGVNIDEFDVQILLDDFFDQFGNWDFAQTPHVTDQRGVMGLLSVIDQSGLLSEVEALKVCSRSTVYRYNKMKKSMVQNKKLYFPNNLLQKDLVKLNYLNTFGPSFYFK